MASTKLELFQKRRMRVRNKLKAVNGGKLRLSVHRSNKNISVQLIDDAQGRTVASASTLEKDVRGSTGATVVSAQDVGRRIAERAKAAGVTEAYFDRGGFLFHGKIKALADAARENGLTI
jgi:large subunit ribosomal protein L18